MEDWLAQRVLAHVPTPQLHESFNVVLQEELASVTNVLSDMAAAFAKLQEVRDAVSQLERNPSGSSASLMAAAGNAMLLQREIGDRIGQLATGMEVAGLVRKRKREEEVDTQEANVARSRVRTDEVETIGERGGGVRQQVEVDGAGSRTSGETAHVWSGKLELSVIANDGHRKIERETVGSSSTESSSESESDDDSAMASGGLKVEAARLSEERTKGASSNSFKSSTTTNGEHRDVCIETARVSSGSDDDSDISDKDADEVEGSEAAWKALMSAGNASSENSRKSRAESVDSAAKDLGVESGRPTTQNQPVSTGNNPKSTSVPRTKTASTVGSSSDSDLESDDDEVEGSEAAWREVMTKGADDKSPACGQLTKVISAQSIEPPDANKKQTAASSSGNLASLLSITMKQANELSPRVYRTLIIPDMLVALKESVEEDFGGTQQSEVASSLKIFLGWWQDEHADQVKHLELCREYEAALEAYVDRLPRSAQKSELQRLADALFSAINKFASLSNPGVEGSYSTKHWAHSLSTMVRFLGVKTSTERREQLIPLLVAVRKELVAVRKELAASAHGVKSKRVFKPMNEVFRWLCEDPRDPHQLYLYRMIVRAAGQFAGCILDVGTRTSFLGLLDNMSELIENPHSPMVRKLLTDIRTRSVEVFRDLRGENVPEYEVDSLIAEVGQLLRHVAVGWKPRQDPVVRACVRGLHKVILRNGLSGKSSKKVCEQRLAILASWKLSGEGLENIRGSLRREKPKRRLETIPKKPT